MKVEYVVHRGMKTEKIVGADSVGVVLPNGVEVELHWRTSDEEISLSSSHGSIVILPRATNVIRIEARR